MKKKKKCDFGSPCGKSVGFCKKDAKHRGNHRCICGREWPTPKPEDKV